jgi:hypothetical protein
MKTVSEYRERALKKKYNYNKKDKTLEIDNEKFTYKLDKTKKGNLATIDPVHGGITIGKDSFKFKHPKTIDFVMHHEKGHLDEKRQSIYLFDKIYIDTEKYMNKIKNKDQYDKIDKILDKYDLDYIIYSKDSPRRIHLMIKDLTNAGVPDLQKYNDNIKFDANVIIPTYNKHKVPRGHGTSLEEYHADIRSTDKVGDRTAIKALKDIYIKQNGGSEMKSRIEVIKKNREDMIKPDYKHPKKIKNDREEFKKKVHDTRIKNNI